MSVVVSSLDLFCAAIALLAVGKGFRAAGNLNIAHKMIGQSFSTQCDSSFTPVGARSLRISIHKGDDWIYETASGYVYRGKWIENWMFNTTWPNNGVQTIIDITNIKKEDQGVLRCTIHTDTQGTKERVIAYLFVHEEDIDHLCPTHWELYPPLGKCIYLSNMGKPWLDARRHCEKESSEADLIIIQDEAFDKFLSSYIHGFSGYCWIGLSDRQTELKFIWPTGKEAIYTNWEANRPQRSTSENCVVKSTINGKWSDTSCNVSNPFLCEKRARDIDELDPKDKGMLIAVIAIIIITALLFIAVMCLPRYCEKRAGPEGEGAGASKVSASVAAASGGDGAQGDQDE
ncbi:hypothetical protein EGW08_008130, partial [Elysia chlorotica]